MDWNLVSQTLEVRYVNGFKFLDKAGEVAASLCEEYPVLRLHTANARGITLVDDIAVVNLDYSHERAALTATGWQGGTEIRKYSEVFFQEVLRSVGVRNLTRVGNLNTYSLTFPSREKSVQHVQKMAGRFGIKDSMLDVDNDNRLGRKSLKTFSLRFDDDTTGIYLNAACEEEVVNITGPYARHLRKSAPPPSERVKLIIDMFTTAPLSVANFLPNALLDSNEKMVKTRILPTLLRP